MIKEKSEQRMKLDELRDIFIEKKYYTDFVEFRQLPETFRNTMLMGYILCLCNIFHTLDILK